MKNRIILSGLLFLCFSVFSIQAQNVLTNKKNVAVSGYDVVSYFKNAPQKGKSDITTEYEGAIYQFSSVENRDLFKNNPTKYTPQYGGWCAYGWSQGYPAKIDPEAWTIVEGKLYLNYNKKVKTDWDKNQMGYIEKANGHWAKRKK